MKQCPITVVKGDKWVSLSLSLGEDLAAQKCAYIKGDFISDVQCQDSACVPWGPKEWGIAILSGARYAFRVVNACHKEIIIHRLEGVLDEVDAEGVSIASALAIVILLGGDSLGVATGEWHQVPSSPKSLYQESRRTDSAKTAADSHGS